MKKLLFVLFSMVLSGVAFANEAPVVTVTDFGESSDGGIYLLFRLDDAEGENMGVNAYISKPNSTTNFEYGTKNGLSSRGNGIHTITWTQEDIRSYVVYGNAYSVRLNVFDEQNNETVVYSGQIAYTYEVDNQSPVISINTLTENDSGDLVLTFSLDDHEGENMGVDAYISNANSTSSYQSGTKTGLSSRQNGNHTITWQQEDIAAYVSSGNNYTVRLNVFDEQNNETVAYSQSIRYSFEVSNSPPSITNVGIYQADDNSLNVQFYISDEENELMDIAGFYSWGDSPGSKNENSEKNLYSKGDGQYSFTWLFEESEFSGGFSYTSTIEVTDSAGNKTTFTTEEIDLRYDPPTPEYPILKDYSFSQIESGKVELVVVFEDPQGDGVNLEAELFMWNPDWQAQTRKAFENLDSGEHRVVWGYDEFSSFAEDGQPLNVKFSIEDEYGNHESDYITNGLTYRVVDNSPASVDIREFALADGGGIYLTVQSDDPENESLIVQATISEANSNTSFPSGTDKLFTGVPDEQSKLITWSYDELSSYLEVGNQYSAKVVVTDSAGNETIEIAPFISYNFEPSNDAPSVSFGAINITEDGSVSVVFTATDPEGGLMDVLAFTSEPDDPSSFDPATANRKNGISSGSHTLTWDADSFENGREYAVQLNVVDAEGVQTKVVSGVFLYTFEKENLPPSITIREFAMSDDGGLYLTVQPDDPEGNPSNIEAVISFANSTSQFQESTSKSYVNSPDKSSTFVLWAREEVAAYVEKGEEYSAKVVVTDDSGNTSTSITALIPYTYDPVNNSPSVTITALELASSGSVSISFTINDPEDESMSVKAYVSEPNDRAAFNLGSKKELSGKSDGNFTLEWGPEQFEYNSAYAIQLNVSDVEGNVTTVVSDSIVFDHEANQPPSIDILEFAATDDGGIYLTVKVNDPEGLPSSISSKISFGDSTTQFQSGTEKSFVEAEDNKSVFITWSREELSAFVESDKNYSALIEVVDAANNKTSKISPTILYDYEPENESPSIAVTSLMIGVDGQVTLSFNVSDPEDELMSVDAYYSEPDNTDSFVAESKQELINKEAGSYQFSWPASHFQRGSEYKFLLNVSDENENTTSIYSDVLNYEGQFVNEPPSVGVISFDEGVDGSLQLVVSVGDSDDSAVDVVVDLIEQGDSGFISAARKTFTHEIASDNLALSWSRIELLPYVKAGSSYMFSIQVTDEASNTAGIETGWLEYQFDGSTGIPTLLLNSFDLMNGNSLSLSYSVSGVDSTGYEVSAMISNADAESGYIEASKKSVSVDSAGTFNIRWAKDELEDYLLQGETYHAKLVLSDEDGDIVTKLSNPIAFESSDFSVGEVKLEKTSDGLLVNFEMTNPELEMLELVIQLSELGHTGSDGVYMEASSQSAMISAGGFLTVDYSRDELSDLYSKSGFISARVSLVDSDGRVVNSYSNSVALATGLTFEVVNENISFEPGTLSNIDVSFSEPLIGDSVFKIDGLSVSVNKLSDTFYSFSFPQEDACKLSDTIEMSVNDSFGNLISLLAYSFTNSNKKPVLVNNFNEGVITKDFNFVQYVESVVEVADPNNNLLPLQITPPDQSKVGVHSTWTVAVEDTCGEIEFSTGSVFIADSKNSWDFKDGSDENFDDESNVDIGVSSTKEWNLRNVGPNAWENFKVLQCNSITGTDCVMTDIEVPYTPVSQTAKIKYEFTAPDQEGTFSYYFKLVDSEGNAVSHVGGHPTFYLTLNAIDRLKGVCSVLGQDHALCVTGRTIEEYIEICEATSTASRSIPIGIPVNVTGFGYKVLTQLSSNGEYSLSAQYSAFDESAVTQAIRNSDYLDYVDQMRETVHFTPSFLINNPSEKALTFCQWDLEAKLFSTVVEPMRVDQILYKSGQLKQLDAELVNQSKQDSVWYSHVSTGSLDAVSDINEQISAVLQERTSVLYAVKLSVSDFFVRDAVEIAEMINCESSDGQIMGVDACLQSKIDAIAYDIQQINSLLTGMDHGSLKNLQNELLAMVQNLDVEGTWKGTIRHADIMRRFDFKGVFARYYNLEGTEVINSNEFAYLVGFQGTILINEYLELLSMKKLLALLKKNGAKAIAKKAALSVFKIGKIGSRLLKGGIAAEKIKTDSINVIEQIKGMRELLNEIANMKLEPDYEPAASASSPLQAEFNSDASSASNVFSIWRPCYEDASLQVKHDCFKPSFSPKLTDSKTVKKEAIRYISRPKIKYMYVENLDDKGSLSSSKLAKNLFGVKGYLTGELCQVHHIIPKELSTVISDLSIDGGVNYFLDEPNNGLPLPSNKCLKTAGCVCDLDVNVRHQGSHSFYNLIVKEAIIGLASADVIKNTRDLFKLRETLRLALTKGRAVLSLNKKESDEANAKEKRVAKPKKNQMQRIMVVFGKYALLHGNGNAE